MSDLLTAEQIEERYGPGDVQYYPAINEEGWKEVGGESLGYRPDLDYHLTQTKVMGIILDLHHHEFIYVSNGGDGESLAMAVTARCHAELAFDQGSILRFILEHPYLSERTYWAEQMKASGVLPEPTAAEAMAQAAAEGLTARFGGM